jgi:hypothetical protein
MNRDLRDHPGLHSEWGTERSAFLRALRSELDSLPEPAAEKDDRQTGSHLRPRLRHALHRRQESKPESRLESVKAASEFHPESHSGSGSRHDRLQRQESNAELHLESEKVANEFHQGSHSGRGSRHDRYPRPGFDEVSHWEWVTAVSGCRRESRSGLAKVANEFRPELHSESDLRPGTDLADVFDSSLWPRLQRWPESYFPRQ